MPVLSKEVNENGADKKTKQNKNLIKMYNRSLELLKECRGESITDLVHKLVGRYNNLLIICYDLFFK
jgi:hypothetical protein